VRLTEHFDLAELTHSQVADRLVLDNTPDKLALHALLKTARGLEQIRALVRVPIIISSGFRSIAVNRAVGSKSDASQHVLGQAADITAPDYGSPRTLMAAIVASKIPYDQVILEFSNPSDPSRGWVHVSFSDRNRKQALLIDGAGTRAYA
jgi:hypothetical protein